MDHDRKHGTGKTELATVQVKGVGTRELETVPCRKLDTEMMGLGILLVHVVDTGLGEWARLHVYAADTGLVEWGMQRGKGHRLAVAVVQEKLLGRSGVAERGAKETRPEAFGSDAAAVERENGRVFVSRVVQEALARLLG